MSNTAPNLVPEQGAQEQAYALWRTGKYDTMDIARMLWWPEWKVCRLIDKARHAIATRKAMP